MGIRRRRKKLTTVINSVDRRLRSVEYRSIPTKIKAASITPAEVAPGTIPSADPRDNGGTGSTSSPTAPSEFAVITAATYSARNITGTVDRVDITTAADHGLLVGEKVTIYGLNNNDVNLDGTYVITEVPTSTTLRFSRGLTGYYQSVINLAVQATVTSRFCSTTTATLTLNSSTHGFVAGDIITVAGVPDDTFFNGDFKVTAVSGADISYNFASAQSSVSVTSSVGYVKSVLHKYVIIGDTWIDTSVTPSTMKIWDGLQWASGSSLPEGAIIDDHMAPKAPTNLSAITSGYYNPTSGQPAVAVTLAWDAPTENADGSALTDLAGYKVFYRYTKVALDGTENGSVGYEPPGQETTYGSPASSDATVSGTFSWNNTFVSTTPAVTITTSAGTLNTGATVIDIKKGKKTALWTVTGLADGEAFTVSWSSSSSNKYGAGSVSGTIGSTTYVYNSTAAESGFSISGAIKATSQTKSTVAATPDVTTDIPSTNEVAPDIQWINAGDTNQTSMSMRDFTVASTVEFAVQAYDSSTLNYSVYSDALTIETGSPAIILSPPSVPTMEARLGTLTVKWDGFDDQGDIPPPYLAYTEVHLGTTAGFTPSASTLKGRMERLGYNELVIANLVYGTTYYAKLIFVSSTGASTQASDSSAGATVVALVDTDVIGQVLSGAKITPNSITASDAIIGNTITGNLIRSNTIEAGSIKTNSLTANQILAGALDAFLITGANIQTAKPLAEGGQNARITINSSGITAYNSSGTSTFSINANTGTVIIGSYLKSGDAASDINNGTTTISGSKITTGTISASAISAGIMSGVDFRFKDASDNTIGYMFNANDSAGDNSIFISYATTKDVSASNIFKLKNDEFFLRAGSGNASTILGSAGGIAISNPSGSSTLSLSFASTTNSGTFTSSATIRSNSNMIVDNTLMVGKTTASNWQSTSGTHAASGFIGSANVGANAASFSRTSSNGDVVNFYRGTTTIVGHIDVTTTSTAYVTSSDYRIKENVIPLEGAISRVMSLKPSRFNFIIEPETTVDGFLAHEVQDIVPEAVSGEKDALYEDGTLHLQGIDQAKLVPLLTAAIQELNVRLKTLEER